MSALGRNFGVMSLALIGSRSRWIVALSAALCLSATALRAETYIVIDVADGKVLAEKDATARWYPASTTKLMTAYLALKALEMGEATLDSPVVVTSFAASQAPSKMGYEPGAVIRLDMALRMIMVKSANDVAVAIGQSLADGSIDAFVGKMNTQASELGMKDTFFINANGLPGPGQYSSAKDLAILGMRLRRDFPAFSEIFGVEAIQAGPQLMRNNNHLLGRFDGADGMKTGYICASGFNIVSSATRGERTLVAVVLGGDGPITRDEQAARLLDAAFKTDRPANAPRVEDLPASSGPPADISKLVCSPEGQKARAAERQRQAEAEKKGEDAEVSALLKKMERPPTTVLVSLGGAKASEKVGAGISQIAAYGIPIPTWRPADDDLAASASAGGAAPDARPETPGDGPQPVAASDAKSARIIDPATDGGALRGAVAN